MTSTKTRQVKAGTKTPVVDVPRHYLERVNGVELSYYQWGRPEPGQPTLLLVHATGFHARVWDHIVERLGERHVVALDQRGHGLSQKIPIAHWNVMGKDLAGLIKHLDLRDIVGLGHSMGGHAMVDAAAECAERFLRLVLVDPTIFAPESYQAGSLGQAFGTDGHPAARRKNQFASHEEMFERFRHRHPYSVFDPEALLNYCRFGLQPDPQNGGYMLACPPAVEASIYMTCLSNPGVLQRARALSLPVLILRAKLPADKNDIMDFAFSPTWPELASLFQDATDIHFKDKTHFLPMEIPDELSRLILTELLAANDEPRILRP